MASKRVPRKVKRARSKGVPVTFDGKTWRVKGEKLDRFQNGKPAYLTKV